MPTATGKATYEAFLERLRARERYEPAPRGRGPEKLAGVRLLLERLGRPERAFKVVHVAGTNGKGMTSAMVASLLREAGRRVGLYTSPHLVDVRERIGLAGGPIGEAFFAQVGTEVLDAAEALPGNPYLSYFDLLTAMGLLAFQRADMEWAVLEVGLGGTSDATNTTEKELAIITRLGLDHMAVLGRTPREIAEQKLGIVRAGVPTVVAVQDGEMGTWLEKRVAQLGSRPVPAPSLGCRPSPEAGQCLVSMPGDGGEEMVCRSVWATGPRLECTATALAAAAELKGSAGSLSGARRLRAALETRWPGRLDYRERVALAGGGGPPFRVAVLDGGHNPAALAALDAQLRAWGIGAYNLIFGLQRDKMVPEVHGALRGLFGRAERIYTLAPRTPRAPAPAEMETFIGEVLAGSPARPPVAHCADAGEALRLAAREPERPLVVSGSFWMLGDVLARLHAPYGPAGAG